MSLNHQPSSLFDNQEEMTAKKLLMNNQNWLWKQHNILEVLISFMEICMSNRLTNLNTVTYFYLQNYLFLALSQKYKHLQLNKVLYWNAIGIGEVIVYYEPLSESWFEKNFFSVLSSVVNIKILITCLSLRHI